MRFDDTLGTVLAADLTTPSAAQAAWRQVVDLIGRGRAPADDRALDTLARIRGLVPVAVRAASARALVGARPPATLVGLLALDDIAVGAPVLRSVDLPADAWIALLPALSPTARAVLRHRRDLAGDVTRALASFGAVDFVLGVEATVQQIAGFVSDVTPIESVPDAIDTAPPIDPGPFVSVGSIALGLPVVAEALRRGNDNEPTLAEDGTFRIADVVARLEAFQRKKDQVAPPPAPAAAEPPEGFRFETDAGGTIRWVEGATRGALIGLAIARQARPAAPGVDGIASGAFRRRTRFADAHLLIGGTGGAAGTWLISGIPVFDRASGRFTGYRGSGRRPQHHERAGHPGASSPADSLRQLVHELRTPTNAIAGFSEMIEHQMLGPVAAPYRQQATAMRGDAGGLLAAIDDLDAAARIDVGALPLHPEPVALAPLLDRVATDLAALIAARGARLALPKRSGTVIADARALERLVARMLGAMIGAAEEGEVITVAAVDGLGPRLAMTVTRPYALDAHPGEAVLAIDDEDSPATLLGIGFTLRLARNLARELDGTLTFGQRHLTLSLPAAVDRTMEQARTN